MMIDVKQIEMVSQVETIDFDKYLIDLSTEIKEPPPLICLRDAPVFTRGNLSVVTGKAKSRKTFLIGLFAARFLEDGDNTSILYIDSEQGKFHVQKSVKRIHRLLQWDDTINDDRLKCFGLRELGCNERLKFLEAAIQRFTPDLVFIDGIRDLIQDFNNMVDSSELVNKLMKLSSVNNCHICSVLHQNKGDNNARGHLGTELINKSESVISVAADGDTSSVSPEYCRNIPFEKFWFTINSEGLPEYCDPVLKPKADDKLKQLFSELLPINESLTYSDLRNQIMEKCNIKTRRGAEKKIEKGVADSIIFKNTEEKYFCIPYNNIINNDDNSTELPF